MMWSEDAKARSLEVADFRLAMLKIMMKCEEEASYCYGPEYLEWHKVADIARKTLKRNGAI
jgi:hypothetical protein